MATTMAEAFVTWKFRGVPFLAVPNASTGVNVLDANHNWYGAWESVDSYRLAQQQCKAAALQPLSATKATGSVRTWAA